MDARAITRGILLAAAASLALITCVPAAAAKPYAPKKGAYHGVSDTGEARDFFSFADLVGAHPATLQMFFHWGVPLRSSGALHRWSVTDTRGVVHVSTRRGDGVEVITPKQIAKGRGDHYILQLNKHIAESRQTVYVRLMAEMNGHFNPYSAHNADGTLRKNHGKKWFKRAWRRFALIVRGGDRRKINRKLRRLNMPRIHRARFQTDPIYAELNVPEKLPRPRVALLWCPLSFGSPNIRGQAPERYWPGGRYVDWIGTDIYAKFRTAFDDVRRFERRWRRKGKPFFIGEYSPWDNDHDGSFVRSLFRWERKHKRVKMLLYYRSNSAGNPHNVQHYPGAQRSLRRILNRRHYREYAPGAREAPDAPPPKPPEAPERQPRPELRPYPAD